MPETTSLWMDIVKIVPLAFVLAVLQVAAAPQFTSSPGGPDLMLVLVVALAMWRSVELAAVTGFLGGLLLDAMSFAPLGTLSLLYVLAAVVIARRARPDPNPVIPGPPRVPRHLVAWTVAAAICVQLGDAVLHRLLGSGLPPGYLMRAQIIPSVIQTGLLALVLSPLLKRMFAPARRTDVSRIATA
ncbi:MAG: rod shape-determining protein MreD [Gaiellales bacterium]